jgi:hypothetical protein
MPKSVAFLEINKASRKIIMVKKISFIRATTKSIKF